MTESTVDEPAHDRGRYVRITTGSRLHFGLLNTIEPFGGVGAIMDEPATQVVVTESREFACTDEQVASRIRDIAATVSQVAGLDGLPSCHVQVVSRPPPHSGLGSGTQLSLAVAEAICKFVCLPCNPDQVAIEIAGRGKRSAVGVHGYFRGAMIHEDSAACVDFNPTPKATQLNPICDRVELPKNWFVLIVRPKGVLGTVSGDVERSQFASLKPPNSQQVAQLRQLVSEQMMPAAREKNFSAFAGAVQAYNRASGMLFESVQGGPYNGQAVTEVVGRLVATGAKGVGQSSWGPGVFCWFQSQEAAKNFAQTLPLDVEVLSITSPRSTPRTVETTL